MHEVLNHDNEQAVASAFNQQAPMFDAVYGPNSIIQYKRERVRQHVQEWLAPHANILELNAGTGEDAVYFARQGHIVHATDLSDGMLEQARQKAKALGLEKKISFESCSFTTLDKLKNQGPYDLIFSNFAGLNCTAELGKVLDSLSPLLNPGGLVTMVILPPFCLWESMLFFKGKFRTATRRFFSSGGRKARIEGNYFTCWYYTPSFVIKRMSHSFDLLDLEGLCSVVPPSYIENFGEKYPAIFRFLKKKEAQFKNKKPWKYIGDYFIISFRKKT